MGENINIEDDKTFQSEMAMVETKREDLTSPAKSETYKSKGKRDGKKPKKNGFNYENLAKRNRNAPLINIVERGNMTAATLEEVQGALMDYNREMKSVTPLLVIVMARKGGRQHVVFPSLKYEVTKADQMVMMTQEAWSNATRQDRDGYYKVDYTDAAITIHFKEEIKEDDPLINSRKYLRWSSMTEVVGIGFIQQGDKIIPGYREKCFVMQGESRLRAFLPELTEVRKAVHREMKFSVEKKVYKDLKPAPWEAIARIGFALKSGDRDRIANARQAAKVIKLNFAIVKNYILLKEGNLAGIAESVSVDTKISAAKIMQYLVVAMCNETFIKHLGPELVPLTERNKKHYNSSRFTEVHTEEKAMDFARQLVEAADMGDYHIIPSSTLRENSTRSSKKPNVRST